MTELRSAPPRFVPGDLVYVKGYGSTKAAISGRPQTIEGRRSYDVLINNEVLSFDEHSLSKIDERQCWRNVRREELLRELAIAKLSHRLTDALYTFHASRTSFEPYQFHPVLKFLHNPNQRILIADEVGLGKTIEAAIIYLELKERLSISRTLILCPSRLTHKWQTELATRFDERFTVLNANDLHKLLGRTPGHQRQPLRGIVSFELFRRSEFLSRLGEIGLPLDLLIVDEAHHMRNDTTSTYDLGANLVAASDAVIFLTATPLHLGNEDLYNLLNLLAPEEFLDLNLFDEQVAPNAHINAATRFLSQRNPSAALSELRKVEKTSQRSRFLNNPYYEDVTRELKQSATSLDYDSHSSVRLQRKIQDLNTLSNVLSRTRKREVSHAALRVPQSIIVTLQPAERALYEAVLQLTRERLAASSGGATGWGAMMPERQAASCLPAVTQRLANTTRDGMVALELERSEFDLLEEEDSAAISLTSRIARASASLGPVDSKFSAFFKVLTEVMNESPDSKILVFSFFKTTLRYLGKRLSAAHIPHSLLTGDISVRDRPRIIDAFRESPATRVMLSSEVGAEGLDFQFCDILVNYDLPWNPMQVEQRIGRLDRFGQTHGQIRIFNFFIENTIETRIFERLYKRIGIFERSIGDLEEILGKEVRKLSQAIIRGTLSEVEEREQLRIAEERIIRARMYQERLEENKDELMGPTSILNQQVQETIASGRYISREETQAIVRTFLAEKYPKSIFEHDEEEPVASLRFDQDLRRDLNKTLEEHYDAQVSSKQLMAITTSESDLLPLTFDAGFAQARPLLELITIRHPLSKMAIDYWKEQRASQVPKSDLVVYGSDDEVGDGYFFIYIVESKGAVESISLESVVIRSDGSPAPNAARRVLSSIQDNSEIPSEFAATQLSLDEALEIAESIIAAERYRSEINAAKRNDALILARKIAIRRSYEAKMKQAQTRLDTETNENIIRMKKSQLVNLQSKMDSKITELEARRDVSVGSRLIAAGRARVVTAPRSLQ